MTKFNEEASPRASGDALAKLGMPRVIAGMWRVREWGMSASELVDFIHGCIDRGVTAFDHADIYGRGAVESLFGEALELDPSLRGKIQIISKAGIRFPSSSTGGVKYYDSSSGYLREACEESLKRLKTDHLDLFLIHRPDSLSSTDDIARAAQTLMEQGKIRAFGVSNFSTRHFELLHAKTSLATNQIEFSPFEPGALDSAMFESLAQANVSPMIWSPLGGGRLFSETDEVARRVRDVMTELQHKHGASNWLAIAYAWIFRLPCVPYVISGSRRIESIQTALDGLKIDLSRQDWYAILEAARGQPVP
ncbi:aldo/keto reductase [Burkholderia sp. Ac-20365]|uniref:aldo/keto reductase n=1 Tax=Burkholderia sp. Ac-20365 TaxID=2703897 RepID=UPI00197B8593|nr:aldo/keto reductase [Burkholderia sp. Ac-20365]MBN3763482.1 aldo/keto reductase [Burkholderia sp. Ac-20365]